MSGGGWGRAASVGFKGLSLEHRLCLLLPRACQPSLLWESESHGLGRETEHILAFNTETIYRPPGGGCEPQGGEE